MICDHLLLISCSRQIQYSLIDIGSLIIPRQAQNDLVIERTDLSTTHEEFNIITMQEPYQFYS